MARLNNLSMHKYYLYTIGIIIYNLILIFIDDFFKISFFKGTIFPEITIIIKIISITVIEPFCLVVLNCIFLNSYNFKNYIKRYINMLLVLCINLLVSVFVFKWGENGILGLPIKCIIVDSMSRVIVTLYSGVAIILLTFEWVIAIALKKWRKRC